MFFNSIPICNAFSLSMVDRDCQLTVRNLTVEEVKAITAERKLVSYIGHQDTADILSSMLGVKIPMRRENLSLVENERAIVVQVNGGRLPEGTTSLPEGFSFTFKEVRVKYKKPCGSYVDGETWCMECPQGDGIGCCQF